MIPRPIIEVSRRSEMRLSRFALLVTPALVTVAALVTPAEAG